MARTHERKDIHIHVYVNTAVPQRARVQNGAYMGQVRHGRGVPRADVRVERQRRLERLWADHIRSTAMYRFHPFIADTGASVSAPVLWGVWFAEHAHIHPREHILCAHASVTPENIENDT